LTFYQLFYDATESIRKDPKVQFTQ